MKREKDKDEIVMTIEFTRGEIKSIMSEINMQSSGAFVMENEAMEIMKDKITKELEKRKKK